jgi:hypothetical protein
MRIAIASDHAAFALKAELVAWLGESGHEVTDLGPGGIESVDYPDYGYKLAEEVAAGRADYGVASAARASASRSPPTAIPPAAPLWSPSRSRPGWPASITTRTSSRWARG